MLAIITATLLAFSEAAVAAPTVHTQESQFRLRVFSSEFAARPTAYASGISYVNNTELLVDLGTEWPGGIRMPGVPAGTAGQTVSQPGDGTQGFSLNEHQFVDYDSSAEVKLIG
ncbi:hypothetical protein DL766_002472 [Monosporascus sp. MC13-8B]|uniref:Peptidase A1 domain-containing protein n=1 Tax=Monosporascus cannonballus TaxID=155416 RepID=A0ABY0HFB3_9PEZI|nr:hypothetical protein DL762_002855 [Monosporascus cannonballus]RYO95592.1 hypothetical protein DL763_003662 [Monosporascus cannonballus]RYP35461.1 hypothetical protein DL766_002472 [Monosporascus sp. MC13-8B]